MIPSANLYRDAKIVGDSSNPYPMMTGHAQFAIPYMANLADKVTDPSLSPGYLAQVIRKTANEFIFTDSYNTAIRALRRDREMHPEWYS